MSHQESHNPSSWRSRYGSATNSTHASKHAFDRVYYSFVTVSLDNSRKVVIDHENQRDEVLQKSTIEEYGKRSTANSRCQGLSQLNLMQYVSQYTKYRSQVRKRSVPYIVRTFPKVSGNPHGPDFGRYCKYQLIKFKP